MLPEEVKQLVGQTRSTRVFQVEKGAIKKFADAVDDRNPLYWDDEYTQRSRYGSIIAPPGFFGWPTQWERGKTFILYEENMEPRASLARLGYSRVLDGGMEYEFSLPVHAGDTLSATSVIKNIMEREGRSGKLVFVIIETTYVNQNGAVVARARSTSISR